MNNQKFPHWAPQIPIVDADDPAIIRICTHTDMREVWEKLYEWWKELEGKKSNRSIGKMDRESFDYYNFDWIRRIAKRCNETDSGSLGISKSEKREYAKTIKGSAKSLRANLRSLGVPSSLTYYLGIEYQAEETRSRVDDFMKQKLGGPEGVSEYLQRWKTGNQTQDDKDFHLLLQDFSRQQIDDPDSPQIYDVLDRIIEIDWNKMPGPLATKEKIIGNRRRNQAIRMFARFLNRALKRNPKRAEERRIIASFVRAALDDNEVTEFTVKDTLKEQKFFRE